MPIEKTSAMLFYLDSGNKPIARFSKSQIDDCLDSSIQEARVIKDMDPKDARPNVTYLCNYCEFRTVCKHFINSK
jgi:lipopolysaccharide biosynthesis regulator YciM